MTDKANTIRQLLAGLFFVGGLCLIILFILTLGKNKGLTEQKFEVPVVFSNIGGLSEGAPVYLSGVTVGGVSSIGFIDKPKNGRRVLVYLNIFERFRNQLERPFLVMIQTEGVLGEKIVQIQILEDTYQELNLSKPLVGQDPLDVMNLADAFTDAAESFTKTATEMSEIDMVELSEVMLESSRALLVTSEGINEIMGELQTLTFKSKRLFDRIEEKVIEGELFKVF